MIITLVTTQSTIGYFAGIRIRAVNISFQNMLDDMNEVCVGFQHLLDKFSADVAQQPGLSHLREDLVLLRDVSLGSIRAKIMDMVRTFHKTNKILCHRCQFNVTQVYLPPKDRLSFSSLSHTHTHTYIYICTKREERDLWYSNIPAALKLFPSFSFSLSQTDIYIHKERRDIHTFKHLYIY